MPASTRGHRFFSLAISDAFGCKVLEDRAKTAKYIVVKVFLHQGIKHDSSQTV